MTKLAMDTAGKMGGFDYGVSLSLVDTHTG